MIIQQQISANGLNKINLIKTGVKIYIPPTDVCSCFFTFLENKTFQINASWFKDVWIFVLIVLFKNKNIFGNTFYEARIYNTLWAYS